MDRMESKMRNNRPNPRLPRRAMQGGFTLMEIIVVVILIGGIVAFAATRILGNADRAKVNLARAQVQTVAEKIHQFEMDTGRLPNTLDELVSAPGNASGWWNTSGPATAHGCMKRPGDAIPAHW